MTQVIPTPESAQAENLLVNTTFGDDINFYDYKVFVANLSEAAQAAKI
jgi:hypothetical protein